jgi:hypothetical protein
VFASDQEVDTVTPALFPGYEFHRLTGFHPSPTRHAGDWLR